MVDRFKQASSIIDYYKYSYTKKFKVKPTFNRTKAKFQFMDILCDYTEDEIKALINYYLAIEREPSINKFVLEYPDLIEKMEHDKRSDAERNRLLQETKARVMEFRKRYGK